MMALLTFLAAVTILCQAASGTYNGWHGGGGYGGQGWHEKIIVKHIPKIVKIPKHIPIPKLIPVPKYLKFLKPLAIAKPVPIPHVVPVIKHFQKPFPVLKGVPFHFPIPLPKLVKLPFPIKLPKPYVVHVPKPYAVPKKFPVAVPVHIPKPYIVPILKSVPVPVPKKVHKVINIVKEVPEYVKKPVPVYVEEKPYKKEYHNPDVGGINKGKGKGSSLHGNSAASFIAAYAGQGGFGGGHAGNQGGYGHSYGGGGGFGDHGLSSSFYSHSLQGDGFGYGLHNIPSVAGYGLHNIPSAAGYGAQHGIHGLPSISGLNSYSGYDGRNTEFSKPAGGDHGISDYQVNGGHKDPTYHDSGEGGGDGEKGNYGIQGQAQNSEKDSNPAYIGVAVTHYNTQDGGEGGGYSGTEGPTDYSNEGDGVSYGNQGNELSGGSSYGNHISDFNGAHNIANQGENGGNEHGGDSYGGNEHAGNSYGGNEHAGNSYSGNEHASNSYSGNEHAGNSYSGNEHGGGYGDQRVPVAYHGQSESTRYFYRGQPEAYPYQGGSIASYGTDQSNGYSQGQIGGGNYGSQKQPTGLRLAIYHPNQIGNVYQGHGGSQAGYGNQEPIAYSAGHVNYPAAHHGANQGAQYGAHQGTYQGQGSDQQEDRYSGQNEDYRSQDGAAKYDGQSSNYEGKSVEHKDYQNEEASSQYQVHQSNTADYSQSQSGPVYVTAYKSQGASSYYQQPSNEENLQGQESEVTGQYGIYSSEADSASDSTRQAEVEQPIGSREDDSQSQPVPDASGYSAQVVKKDGTWQIVPRS